MKSRVILLLALFLPLLTSCVTRMYSPAVVQGIRQTYLNREVTLPKKCYLIEYVERSKLSLYDESGRATSYVFDEPYWLLKPFRKPDHQIGTNWLYDLSRYSGRDY